MLQGQGLGQHRTYRRRGKLSHVLAHADTQLGEIAKNCKVLGQEVGSRRGTQASPLLVQHRRSTLEHTVDEVVQAKVAHQAVHRYALLAGRAIM